MRTISRFGLSPAAAMIVIAALVLAPAALLAQPPFTTVNMLYTAGETCSISVDPDPAKIFKDRPPRKVMWVALNEEEFFWEIRWSIGKADNQPDFFSASAPLNIACGDFDVRSKEPHGMREVTDPRWPYMVTVYSCVDGVQGPKLCDLDPSVEWDD